VSPEKVERAIAMIDRLEELDDVGKIVEVLTAQNIKPAN
jgi:transcriptional/translational regulatory protein YebC/TACO1